MSKGLYFVDTNVLVYARDASESIKQPRAMDWLSFLWESKRGRISFQVLNEFYITVTQKLKPGLQVNFAQDDVRNLLSWQPIPTNQEVIETAWTIQNRFKLAWWDCLIAAESKKSKCRYLLTEDLQHEMNLDGLIVINPFKRSPQVD